MICSKGVDVMILTDYFKSERDLTWNYALQCGVKHGVIRLPENNAFDITDFSHWQDLYGKFTIYSKIFMQMS